MTYKPSYQETFPEAVVTRDLHILGDLIVDGSLSFTGITIAGYLKISNQLSKVFADSPYTATSNDLILLWNTAGGNCIQNLPDINTVRNQVLFITKRSSDGNTVTIDPNGAQTIGGDATLVLPVIATAMIIAPPTGTDWIIL